MYAVESMLNKSSNQFKLDSTHFQRVLNGVPIVVRCMCLDTQWNYRSGNVRVSSKTDQNTDEDTWILMNLYANKPWGKKKTNK